MKERSFIPNQKFLAYEYEREKENYSPHLFQAVTAETLERCIDWLLESMDKFSTTWGTRRGYDLPLVFTKHLQDESEFDCPHSQRPEVTFYRLRNPYTNQPTNFEDSEYFKEAVFLSNLQGYTCTAVSLEYNTICWSAVGCDSLQRDSKAGHPGEWELYRSLKDSDELFAIAIDEYNEVQEFVRMNTSEEDSPQQPKIGAEWVLSEQDILKMHPHDLFFFFHHNQAYLMDYPGLCWSDFGIDTDSSFDYNYDAHALLFVAEVEDMVYRAFCDKWRNNSAFRGHFMRITINDERFFPEESLARYLDQLKNIVEFQIYPMKKYLSLEVYNKWVNSEDILAFIKRIPFLDGGSRFEQTGDYIYSLIK